jgi:amidophosphoribosyltransferase
LSEGLTEACGVFGAISTSKRDVFHSMYWGLLSLNHRGQQSYGFLTLDNGHFHKKEDLNLVPTDPRKVSDLTSSLRGPMGISNARYATSGGIGKRHLEGGKQPLVVSSRGRKIAISYNGNIVNTSTLKNKLRKEFGKFRTDADTEVLAKQILLSLEENSNSYSKAIGDVLDNVEGAYSAMIIDSTNQTFYAFRDTRGIRPFCFGRHKDLYAFASETPALDINGFSEYDYVDSAELISVAPNGRIKREKLRKAKPALCAFEFAYFSRPDSILNGTKVPVYKIREKFAKTLGRTYKKKLSQADLILSMPETADDSAYGLHEASGIPWERAIRKNRYVTRRAFISGRDEREDVIDKKVNIVSSLVRGKHLIVMEDSIVRGDTSKANIAKLNATGAKSVDLFVTFPRITNPCLYGVDMATYKELIGARMDPDQIAVWLGADSVNFQTIDGLVSSIGIKKDNLCLACVTGTYPTKTAQELADKIRSSRSSESRTLGSEKRIYERSIA